MDKDIDDNNISVGRMTTSMLQKKLLISEDTPHNNHRHNSSIKNHRINNNNNHINSNNNININNDTPIIKINNNTIQVKSFLEENEQGLNKDRLPRQVYDLVIDSIPNVASCLGIFYYNFINMVFVRQFNDSLIMGSFGMGVTWYNSTCLCFLISFGNGLFIQLAQAYGAKNYKLMSELYQRSQAIEFGVGIISSILLYNTFNILVFLGISEDISYLTEQFAVACIPSVFGTVLNDTTKQLLIAMNNFDIPMKVQLLVYFIHPLWCYLFAFVFDLGLIGIGLARGVSEYTSYFILCYIIKKRHLCDDVWNNPYNFKSMFQDWIPFLKISIPVGCLVFLEWIFFEIQTIIVARLNDDKILAGQTAFQSIIMFFYMVPLGLSTTTNSYLGNAVGEGKKRVCLNFSKISMLTVFVEVIIFMIVGQFLKDFFTSIFVTDDEMEIYFSYAYNMYLYTFILGDYFQVVLNGILRCCNEQNYAAYITFIVYYIFGLPLTYFLTFIVDLGLGGVWLSQSIVATTVSILFYIKIRSLDWDQSIKSVQDRVQQEQNTIQNQLQQCNKLNDIELMKLSSHFDVKTPSCSPNKISTA